MNFKTLDWRHAAALALGGVLGGLFPGFPWDSLLQAIGLH